MKNKVTFSIKILLIICIFMSIFCSSVSVFANDPIFDEAAQYISQAYSALGGDNYDLALDYCNKAISIRPEPGFYCLKAQVLKYQENYQEALNTLEQALAVSPEYADIYIEKASIYSTLNKNDEMFNSFDEGIAAAPNHIPLYVYKASALLLMNKTNEAIECYKLGIKNNPKDLSLYAALSYQLFNVNNISEIIVCLNKIIELDPYNDQALYNIACAYSFLGKPDEALVNLKKAIQISPECKVLAMHDEDFDNIKNSSTFEALTGVGVYVDGKFMEFDVPPTIEDGRVLLPLRLVFETLGASIEWIDSTKTVKGQLGGTTLSLQVGSKTAIVNGDEVSLDVPGKIVSGRTLVPLRFVSESFGADVIWDPDTKTVYVTSPEENINNAGHSRETIIDKLDASLDILPVDGIFPEPYGLDPKEAKMILVAKSEEDLNLFRALSREDKIDYLNKTVQQNYGSVLACDNIEASFVYDNKMYYRVYTTYEANPQNLELEVYKLGMLVNVIEQDDDNFTFRYYYGE